ncbi:PhzF family phenazine biosynthesis protein [Bradyrhizobium roseum]|uniref:PhzF family phenazine biosynthesis protein n=1 Tax=Bradyrhizobium roseum TaxID=3056648 RepID=UPI0026227372|nr:PhzF family phenazine biosynthesis protein [Bradyrhizobium roseus]WKA25691.1 PhzF family phenazine biosynthesis protein [Bradyrhizobium roseus]
MIRAGQNPDVFIVNVFRNGPGGGNPAPVVLDASLMTAAAMRELAAHYGHESAFVLPGRDGCDLSLRFFVPNHEMEMCGHATLGTVWLLKHLGLHPGPELTIATLSGIVTARMTEEGPAISQPAGRCEPVDEPTAILDVLGLRTSDLEDFPVMNAMTSRTKTLVPVRSRAILDSITPDFSGISEVCGAIGSTGLYPFAIVDRATATLAARQFPKSSGYPEDAATGIAATALASGLRQLGVTSSTRVTVHQGDTMGRPSKIFVTFRNNQCWLSGHVELMEG